MSIEMALEGTRDYLRGITGLDGDHVGIEPGGVPPSYSPDWYVALDDGGVDSDDVHNLIEIFTIEVSIWRKTEGREDVLGQMLLRKDPVRPGIKTLGQIESIVKEALHRKYELPAAINSQFDLPQTALGDVFSHPLYYKGRSKSEQLRVHETNSTQSEWYGRRLRFRGLNRCQDVPTQK